MADGLAGSGRGGRRGRMGEISVDDTYLVLGHKTGLVLGETSSDKEGTGNMVLGRASGNEDTGDLELSGTRRFNEIFISKSS